MQNIVVPENNLNSRKIEMDFTKICRLCLEEKVPMREIFSGGENNSLKEIFSQILKIEVGLLCTTPQ